MPKFIFTILVMPSNHLILWCPLLLLPPVFPSLRDVSNELVVRIRWPKYWSFSIIPSNENSGLIALKVDWFDLYLRTNPGVCLEYASIELGFPDSSAGKESTCNAGDPTNGSQTLTSVPKRPEEHEQMIWLMCTPLWYTLREPRSGIPGCLS